MARGAVDDRGEGSWTPLSKKFSQANAPWSEKIAEQGNGNGEDERHIEVI